MTVANQVIHGSTNGPSSLGPGNGFFSLPGPSGQNPTEAVSQFNCPNAGVFSQMTAVIVGSAVETFTFRNAGANGNENLPITAAGTYTDTTDTDSVSANTLVAFAANPVTTAKTPTAFGILFNDSNTSNCTEHVLTGALASGITVPVSSLGNTGKYALMNGTGTAATPLWEARQPGTIEHLQIYIISNANTASSTYSTVYNGTTGAPTITISAHATGHFEDTTGTQSFVSGDSLYYESVTTTTGAIKMAYIGSVLVFSGGAYDAGSNITNTITVKEYYSPWSIAFAATEKNVQILAMGRVTMSNMRVYVSSNSGSNPTSVVSRVTGVTGNQNFSISAGATGWFEDAVNTDSYQPTDLISFMVTPGSGDTVGIIMAMASFTPVASITYNQTCDAFSGSNSAILARQTGAVRLGSASQSSVVARAIAAVLLASNGSFSGILSRSTTIARAGVAAQTASLKTNIGTAFAILASAAASGILSRATSIFQVGSAAAAGSTAAERVFLASFSVSISMAGALVRSVLLPISSAISSPATLMRSIVRSILSSRSVTGLLVRQTAISRPASSSTATIFAWKISLAFLSGISTTASLVKSSILALLAQSSTATSSSRTNGLSLLSSTNPLASQLFRFSRALLAQALTTAALALAIVPPPFISAITVRALFVRGFLLNAVSWVAPLFQRAVAIPIMAHASAAALLQRGIVLLSLASASCADLAKRAITKTFASTTAPHASLVRSIQARLLAAGANAALFTKAVARSIAAQASALGLVARKSTVAFLGSAAASAFLARATRLALLASSSVTATRKVVIGVFLKAQAQAAAAITTVRQYARAILVPVHAFGALSRALTRKLLASTNPVAVMRFTFALVFAASAAASASLTVISQKQFLAIAQAGADLVKAYAHLQLVLARSTALLRRGSSVVLPSASNASASLEAVPLKVLLASAAAQASLVPVRVVIALATSLMAALFQKLMQLVSKPKLMGSDVQPYLSGSDTQPTLNGSADEPNLTGKIE